MTFDQLMSQLIVIVHIPYSISSSDSDDRYEPFGLPRCRSARSAPSGFPARSHVHVRSFVLPDHARAVDVFTYRYYYYRSYRAAFVPSYKFPVRSQLRAHLRDRSAARAVRSTRACRRSRARDVRCPGALFPDWIDYPVRITQIPSWILLS